jgi:hypothetical protein
LGVVCRSLSGSVQTRDSAISQHVKALSSRNRYLRSSAIRQGRQAQVDSTDPDAPDVTGQRAWHGPSSDAIGIAA